MSASRSDSSPPNLTFHWPMWMLALSLGLTALAVGWLASAGPRAAVTGALVVAGAGWVATVFLLKRWRAQERREHRTLLERIGRLEQRIADLTADLERRAATCKQAEAQLASVERALRESESEQEQLRARTEQAVAGENAAQAGERAKAEYLARISRDIRAPLTTILGFTQMLVDMGDLSKAPTDRLEALYTIKQEGQQLLDAIDDTLELCALELQECRISPARCALTELIDGVYRAMAGWAEARGLRLLVDYHTPVPQFITTDAERLSQILINLLGNAVKFTLRGDIRLKIELTRDEPEGALLCFEVLDSGIGMHQEQSSRLFGGFAVAAAHDRRLRGAGLGLTISKKYAEMLGGDIVLLDTMPGIGTRVRLSIRPDAIDESELIQPQAAEELAEPALVGA